MNYISIFKNRGKKISHNLILRRQTTQLKTGKRFKRTFFTREDPWMHVSIPRGFLPAVSGNALNTSVAQSGSKGKGRGSRVVAKPYEASALPVGSMGPQVAAVQGDRPHAGMPGESQENGAQGRSQRNKPHAQSSRKRRRTYECKSTKRPVVAREGVGEEACGERRDDRGAGACPSPSSALCVHCMHTSTPTLVCTACCVWVTPG